ncbi:MAG: 50S ribosomal protein L24 [Firmicutes bacterium]|uniref:Large ribosomal subunit protein uL24 n=1 Tax=Melghirimyces thermohalophilus TaxID=1236220 RepID=A0A1G6PEB5_9BACL|nr:50S ribosomal protein L24 [Melghirimyces thermohalophilus]MDA8352754.1 50S ribosomal protein L24 [Bacillota bacterium]SDC78399.1 large subunit ribosomal protein L24 [Melghirimyces thermohalophilus]
MAQRPNKLHIKKGDTVIVTRGKDAPTRDKNGKMVYTKGRVLKVFPAEQRALVEGVNMVKKHSRPTQDNPQGGIIEQEAPVHISNLMLEDPKTKEPTRVGYKVMEGKGGKEKKVRYAKKSGEVID